MNEILQHWEWLVALLLCFPFLGVISTSESNATDATAAANDDASAATYGGAASKAGGVGTISATGASVATDQGTILGGASGVYATAVTKQARDNAILLENSKVNTGFDISGVTGNVVIGDNGKALADNAVLFTSTLKELNAQNATATTASTKTLSEQLRESLSKIGELATAKSSDGFSTWAKHSLYLILGLGVLFFAGRWLIKKLS